MERLRMRRSDLFPLQLHTFEDTQFYVPHHSDTILKTDLWRLYAIARSQGPRAAREVLFG